MSPPGPELEPALALIRRMPPGFGLLRCSSGQQAQIAQALAAAGLLLCATWEELREDEARPQLLFGPPEARGLGELNSRRDRLTAQGLRCVLVVDRPGLGLVLERARDLASVLHFREPLPYLPQLVDPAAARELWTEELRRRHGQVALRGLLPGEGGAAALPLEALFVPPALLLMPDAEAPMANAPQELRGLWAEPPARPEAQLPAEGPALLLGLPGAGKSALLRWRALQLCASEQGPLPLLLPLGALTEELRQRDLLAACREELLRRAQPLAHCLEQLAAEGKLELLLDGLDEVGGEEPQALVVQRLEEHLQRHPNLPLRLTSRSGSRLPPKLPGPRLELAPFDAPRVLQFLVGWGRLLARAAGRSTEEGEAEGRRLADELHQHEALRQLCGTPLLLTVLAALSQSGLELPEHRAELYDHMLRLLVERWGRLRPLEGQARAPNLGLAEATRLLGPVALELVEGERADIEEERLRLLLQRGLLRPEAGAAAALLELLRQESGLLLESAPGRWAFLHQALAEHLCALELIRSRRLMELARDPRRAALPRWREPLVLAAGILGRLRADDLGLSELTRALLESSREAEEGYLDLIQLLSLLWRSDPGLLPELNRDLQWALWEGIFVGLLTPSRQDHSWSAGLLSLLGGKGPGLPGEMLDEAFLRNAVEGSPRLWRSFRDQPLDVSSRACSKLLADRALNLQGAQRAMLLVGAATRASPGLGLTLLSDRPSKISWTHSAELLAEGGRPPNLAFLSPAPRPSLLPQLQPGPEGGWHLRMRSPLPDFALCWPFPQRLGPSFWRQMPPGLPVEDWLRYHAEHPLHVPRTHEPGPPRARLGRRRRRG